MNEAIPALEVDAVWEKAILWMGEEQPPRVEDELIHLIVNRCPWWAFLTVLDKLIMYCESYNRDALNELMADRAYHLEGQPPDCRCSTVRTNPRCPHSVQVCSKSVKLASFGTLTVKRLKI